MNTVPRLRLRVLPIRTDWIAHLSTLETRVC
jgi:hypothetical protein